LKKQPPANTVPRKQHEQPKERIKDRDDLRFLGAHILAAGSGEVIQTAALVVRPGLENGSTVKDLREALLRYLSQVEGLRLAALPLKKVVAQLSC
jgi:pyruvate/2-oxoglutarate dehydrogenase complex dihydrolipoamide dehydrogenase (E3) component